MELKLTLEELESILNQKRAEEERVARFNAALQGVNMDEETGPEVTFEDIKRKAEAINSGMSEEELSFGEVGIAVITE